jgi:penicillin-binding protein 1A
MAPVPTRGIRRLAAAVVLGALGLSACSYQTTGLAPELPTEAQTSQILAADGSVLTTLQAEQNRVLVHLDDLPLTLRDAVVSIEDDRFWDHRGIDLRAILRAAHRDASEGGISEGGSTITQQYVKTALLDPTQTVNRKLREAVLAVRLERSYSKEVILERYLNTIYFGRGAYGAAAAAEEYFAKPVGRLDLAESALLAGLIQAPSARDPYVRPDQARARRDVVLGRMLELGRIGRAAHDAAVAEPLALAPERPATERYPAAHFVEAVKQWILGDPRFGPSDDDRRNLLFKGGLRVTTTLDPRLQSQAEDAVWSVLPDPATYPEGALVAVEPGTGYVRAMVGGRDYFGTSPFAKVNLALGEGRQAGSTFKPFVLAAALDAGIPLTRTYPAPAQLTIPLGNGEAPWEVHNYGDAAGGVTSLLDATVWSYNTAYAELMMDVGPGRAVDMARRLGVASPLQAVPSAVLGTQNVTVLDMASAYGTFANRGRHVMPVLVTSITRADGSVLYQSQPDVGVAVPAAVADQVNWALGQVVQRGTGTAARLDRPAAGKTGTAEAYRDAWFVGYTPDLAAAVWVGFAEGQVSMTPPVTPLTVTGGSWPAEIWQRFMRAATDGQPSHAFPAPDPALLRAVDAGSSARGAGQPASQGLGAGTSTTGPAGGPGDEAGRSSVGTGGTTAVSGDDGAAAPNASDGPSGGAPSGAGGPGGSGSTGTSPGTGAAGGTAGSGTGSGGSSGGGGSGGTGGSTGATSSTGGGASGGGPADGGSRATGAAPGGGSTTPPSATAPGVDAPAHSGADAGGGSGARGVTGSAGGGGSPSTPPA